MANYTIWTDHNALEAYLKLAQLTVLLGIRSLLRKGLTMHALLKKEFFRHHVGKQRDNFNQ
jgi:hypothetical protein